MGTYIHVCRASGHCRHSSTSAPTVAGMMVPSKFPTSSGEEHGRRCVEMVSVGTTSNREVSRR